LATLFDLHYTPYVLPFVASFALTVGLAIHALRRPRQPLFTTFAAVMVAMSVWIACYALELSSATFEGKTFWAMAKYLGSATGPAIWFVLALRLTRNERWLTPAVRAALAAFSAGVVAAVFTNPWHHLFWTDIRLVPGEPESDTDQGPLFWVYAAGLYFFVLASVVVFALHYRTAPPFHRNQAALLSVGAFLPLAGRILEDFFGIDLFPKLDNVILLLLFSVLLWGWAIFRFGALDIVHVAHDLVVRNIRAGIIVLDPQERVVELNPYAAALAGVRSNAAIGKRLRDVLADWPDVEIAGAADVEVAVQRDGAETHWFQTQVSPIDGRAGEPVGWALVLFDVTARKAAERGLEELARTDPLTGITNRRHFFELAAMECARARRYESSLAIAMLDVDHFKRVNDVHGHRAGDAVLAGVAAACKQHLRATDLFARYGGEEFICVFGEGDVASARETAERLRQVVEATRFEFGGTVIPVTISVGVAHARDEASLELADLVEQADRALYASKSAGRNRVTVAGEEA
jgi:diguanylate cyclase (GGDEF)-like protein/PAS domain S-box-containing protein